MATRDRSPSTPSAPAPAPRAEDGSRARTEAVSALFREHNRTLVRFLQAKLRDEQEALEVAQESYVRLLELGHTQAVSFLRAYLFRIALNLAIDRLRSRGTRERIDAARLAPIEDLIGQAVVEKHVFAADDMRVFWASLDELPEPYRQAFVLSRLENLSTADIARRLGKSDRMVRRYVVHALVYCRLRVSGLSSREAKERMTDE